MKYNFKEENPIYSAPFLGNGAITLGVDPDGSMNPPDSPSIVKFGPGRSIFWAARRYPGSLGKPLIPFGRFIDDLGEAPIEAEQELDAFAAEVRCDARYPSGNVKTEVFVHTDCNLVAVKKTLLPTASMTYTYTYDFCKPGKERAKSNFVSLQMQPAEYGARMDYEMTDRLNYRGTIRVACDQPTEVTFGEHSVSLSVTVDAPTTLTFFLLLDDTIDHEDPAAFTNEIITKAVADGYDAVKAVHGKVWSDYYTEGYAKTGDPSIDRAYLVAQYHQKCFTTKWSLPVGLYDASWNGRCFGFDEFYMQCGLVTSNHREAASRAPLFRHKGWWQAVQRATFKNGQAAHYPWETLEDGTEGAPVGFFRDHIFHMAAIPLSGWEYYSYTNDVEFMEKRVYPVLYSCMDFFRLHMLYRVEGTGLIVGKCTDLERLGSHRENAYMTTCGVIATFLAFAEASEILQKNLPLAQECRQLAKELKDNLPQDGKRYVPFPGCEERSISAFSGTHPFDVIDRDDPLQAQAMADYLAYEDQFGNMYEMGSGVCSWYACWKGVVYDRMGRSKDAIEALRYVASTTGDFGEMFEINNAPSKTYVRPWFTTAAGMYAHAVNEALIQSKPNGEIWLFRGLDETFTDVKFRLAARGGLAVECEVKDGKLVTLRAEGNEHCTLSEVTVHLPAYLGGDRKVAVTK